MCDGIKTEKDIFVVKETETISFPDTLTDILKGRLKE